MAKGVGGSPRSATSVGGTGRGANSVGGSAHGRKHVGRKDTSVTGTGAATLILRGWGLGEHTRVASSPPPEVTGVGDALLILTGDGLGSHPLLITGTGAATLGLDAAGAGTHFLAVTGTGAATFDSLGASGVGTAFVAITGTGAATFSLTTSAEGYVGAFEVTGAGDATLILGASAAGASYANVTGLGAATLVISGGATGSHYQLVTGTGAATLALIGAGAGSHTSATTTAVDLDFVSGTYSGGALTDLHNVQPSALSEATYAGGTTSHAANTVRRNDMGLWVRASDLLTVDAASNLASILTGTTGYVCLEVQQLERSPSGYIAGDMLTFGADSGLAAISGSQVSSGVVTAKALHSGLRGICRIAVTWDATDRRISMDGGPVGTSALAFSRTGVIELFQGVSGRIRRIRAASGKLSDAALRAETTLENRTLVRAGTAYAPGNIGATAEALYHDFDTDPLQHRTTWTSPQSGYESSEMYRASYLADTTRILKLHMHYRSSGTRYAAPSQFSGEPVAWLDYDEPANFRATYIENSDLVQVLQRTANLTPAQRALVPINPSTGQPYLYVGSFVSTYADPASVGGFRQKYGIISARIKIGNFPGSWSAFWRYTEVNTGHTEDDIFEIYGGEPGTGSAFRQQRYETSLHSGLNGNGQQFTFNDWQSNDVGYDLHLDYRVHTRVHLQNSMRVYVDGELVTTSNVGSTDFNTDELFIIFDFDVYPGAETSATNAIIDAQDDRSKMRTDHLRVLRFT